jgi:L-ascorbate metabolism protein UlaG (beta-lactamase superfamily)
VPAWHDSSTPGGKHNSPAGIVVEIGGAVVYHLGDTCLFSDLKLVGRKRAIDVALVPIGGHFTMDRHDAVDAADFIGAKTIIPCHYNTMPAIETDVNAFATDIEKTLDAIAVVLEPGASHTV